MESTKRSGNRRHYSRAYLLGIRALQRRSALFNWLEQLESRVMLTALDYHAGFADSSGVTFNGNASPGNTNAIFSNPIPGNPQIASNSLLLTDNTPSEISSFFFNNKQDITGFSLQFDYRITGTWPIADGFTFVIQNAGINALGQGGGGLGYGASETGGTGGIGSSVAIKFDIFDSQGEGNNSTGISFNGEAPTTTGSVNLGSGVNAFDMRSYSHTRTMMTYNGSTLTVVIKDLDQGATNPDFTVTQQYTVDIPAIVGGSTAWIGFTGSSGALRAVQEIDNLKFDTIPVTPGTPTGLTPTAGDGQVGLSWNAVSGAASYTIKYGTTNGGPYDQTLTGVTGTSTTVPGLTNGTNYYFVITAVNAGGESAASSQVTALPQVAAPAIPTGLTPVAGDTKVDLSWNAVAGAATYTVKYGTTLGGPYTNTLPGLTGTTDSVTGLTNGTTYYFVITATNPAGESGASAEVVATPQLPAIDPPAAPTGVAPSASNGQVSLSWSPTATATSYTVRYGTTDGGPYTIPVSGISGTSTTITGLTNGTQYYFVVTASNTSGEGAASTQVTATPQVPAPGVPTGFTATAGSQQVSFTWNAVALATSYTIKYGTTLGGPYTTPVTGLTGTSTTITGLTSGTPYYFIIEAVNAGGTSADSAEKTATPLFPPPAAPTNLTPTAGDAHVALTWTAVPGATSYKVKYSTTNGGPYTTVIPNIPSNSTDVTGLTDGTTYYFVVTAVGVGGESVASSQATALPIAPIAAAPTGLNATPGDAQVSLNWTASAGAVTYTVHYGTTLGGPYTGTLASVAGTSTTVTGLTNGTTYYFVVTAVNSGGESGNSNEANAAPVSGVPAIPTGVTTTVGNGQIGLSWTSVPVATSYNIKYGTTPGGPYTTTVPVASGTSANVTGLTNGTAYYFVVTAVGPGGESAASAEKTATPVLPLPVAPTGVGAAASLGQVALSWNAVPTATSYTIKYSTISGGPYNTNVPVASGTSFTVTGLTNDTTYYFVVVANNATGAGPASTQVTGTPNAALNFPTGFAGAGSSVQLNGSASINNGNIQLTSNAAGQVGTAYGVAKQNVATFTTQFDYRIDGDWPLGDGFTFVIQNSSLFAIGQGGGGLGYGASGAGGSGGIPNSIAIKFDVYDNQGEGTNSTGLYVNGAAPTNVGSVDLGSGNNSFNMRSYDNTRATITYDGTTLTVVLKDLVSGFTVTQHYTIDIPGTIGSSSAWIGFTASSGSLHSNQNILNWTYSGAPNTPQAPAAPTGVTPVVGNNQIGLSWSASSGATSYKVKYGTTPGGPYTTTVPVTGTSTTITGLTNGTTYYFVVSAINGVGEGANSAQVGVAPVAPSAPAAPAGVTAVGGNAQIAVNWTASVGATSYNVKYSTTAGGPYTTVSVPSGTSKTLTGLTNGTIYYVVVSAVNGSGEGLNSTEKSATPSTSAVTLDFSGGFATAASLLHINGSAFLNNGILWLTNNVQGEVSSVYANTQQNITGFTTTFDYQLTGSWPLGDGFTFVIQNSNLNAIGKGGAGLGYGSDGNGLTGGIGNSIAIKFDMFDSQGEGNNSTGLYVNGAAPTNVGAVNLNGTGFDMRSYDLTHATITYDGTTLTVTLKDTVTNATVTQSYVIDIPATIGSSNAWVGFTASSGALVANQAISTWKYTTQPPGPATPAAPTGVTPVAGNAQVALSWTAVSGATSYNVKYSTTPGGPYTTVAVPSGTTKTITGLTNGTPYYFVVAAVNGVGEGANSTEVTSSPLAPTLPTAPTGVSITGGNTQAILTWTAVPGATSYNVKYGTTLGGPYGTTVTVSSATATVTGLTNGTPYYFVVTAVNSIGESGNSAEKTVTPSASQVTLSYPSFPGADPSLKLNGSAFISQNRLWLTNNVQGEVSSVYATTQQNVTGFTTSFDYQTTGSWPLGDGFTFVIQRAGLSAIGLGGAGLGYGADHTNGNGGIANSVAIKFDVFDSQGEGTNSTGLFVNGAAPTNVGSVNLGGTGFDMRSYDITHVTMAYDGTTLTVTLTDTVTHATATQHYTIDIPSMIGGTNAWVGFTASSGALIANQAIINWQYTSIPPVPTVPVAPTGLVLTPGNGQIGLTWNSSNGATSYNVKYGTTPGGPYTTTVPVNGTSANITGLTNNTTYYFVVSAINGVGEGANSGQLSAAPVAPSAPAAPTGLTATPGYGQVKLTWTASAGATSYNVKYGTTSGGPYGTVIGVSSGTTLTIPGLTNGTNYYFVVSAVNGLGEGANTAQVTAAPSSSLVTLDYSAGFPTSAGLTMNGDAQITANKLLLTNNFGGLKSNVYATTQQDISGFTTTFDYKLDGTWPLGDGFTFVIQRAGIHATGVGGGGLGYGADHVGGTGGIPNSLAIKFDVYDNQGEGTNSTGMYVNGAAPTNVGAIDVGWNNSGFNLRSYDLTRATISYDGTTLTVVLKDLVSGATVTQNYAVDIPTTIGGNMAWVGFTAASGHMGANQAIYNWTFTEKPNTPTAPSAPTGVTPVAGVNQVALSWNTVNTALSYNVKYGTTPGGPYNTVVPVAGTSTTITGLTVGTPYYFIVTAVNGVGEGLASSQVTATPVAPSAPGAPTGLGGTAGNHQVALTWTASAGATSYNVKYGTTAGGPYTTLNVPGTSTTVTSLTNGTPYFFVVSAVNANGEGVNSSEVTATPSASTMTLNFGAGFPSSAGLTMNGDAQIQSGKLLLTNNFGSLKSNVYATAQQDITGFTTTFDYKVDGTWPLGDGFTFVIQRAGLNASGVGGGGLGYGADHVGGTGGIPNSLAIKFDLYDNQGEGTNSTGMYLNGAAPTNVGAVDAGAGNSGFNMRSYDLTRATFTYDGTTLTVTLKDLVSGATTSHAYTVDIPTVIGGTTAWVGFTAASGHFGANQAIYNWTYTTVPVIANPPAVPTGVSPVIGSGQVGLSWNAVAGATSYNVKYGTTNGGPYTIPVPVAGTNTVISGLTNNTPYYFIVTAVNGAGESSPSTQVTATPVAVALPVPATPTGLGASAGNTLVALNWNPVAGATSYTIHYSTTSGGPYGLSATNIAGTSTSIQGLTNGTPYFFVVTAVNSSGESLPSTEVTATPAAAAQGLNFSTGFATASNALSITGAARIDNAGNLLLTTNAPSQLSSVFAKTKQNVAAFTTSFDFQVTGSWPLGDGFTFTIQNASQTAIGQPGAGLGYGTTNLGAGIGSSIAIKFDVNDNAGEGTNSTGLYINGATPTNTGSVNLNSTGFDMRSYNPSRATLTYDGTTLTVVLQDLVSGATATQHYTVNIPSIVGGNLAWIGFTASNSSIVSNQTITKWTYTG